MSEQGSMCLDMTHALLGSSERGLIPGWTWGWQGGNSDPLKSPPFPKLGKKRLFPNSLPRCNVGECCFRSMA